MRAMVLEQPEKSLVLRDVPKPKPGPGQLLVGVKTCAVCRTDLHIVDGELPNPKLPLIPGTKSSAASKRSAKASKDFQLASASAFRGSAGPTATALIVDLTVRIFAIARVLPAIQSTVVTPISPSPMRDFVFVYLTNTTMSMLRRFSAPECSATARIVKQATRRGSAFMVSAMPRT